MTPRRNRDERASRADEMINAQRARHDAWMVAAMAAHERAIAAGERRIAQAMQAHGRAMEAMERRIADAPSSRRSGAGRAAPPEDLAKRLRRKRPPGEEGGEPVPAIPRPKPRPLAGAASIPIE